MINPQVVLVTGSSTGFGRLTVETLARQGHTVYAGLRDVKGRNAEKGAVLRDLAIREGLSLTPLDLDVINEVAAQRTVATILAETGRLDVLVNNAGIMWGGVTEGYTLAQARSQMETNFFGSLILARAVLPAMRQQQSGLLVQVSSLAGGLVFPFYGLYCASKMAIEAVVESLRYELAPLGIDAVIVEPGPFGTALLASQVAPADTERVADYGMVADIPAQMFTATEQLFTSADAQDPLQVADLIAALIAQPFGSRPLRSIPGTIDFGLTPLNATKLHAQQALLRAWGLADVLSQRPPE